jgi:hypothetical protein
MQIIKKNLTIKKAHANSNTQQRVPPVWTRISFQCMWPSFPAIALYSRVQLWICTIGLSSFLQRRDGDADCNLREEWLFWLGMNACSMLGLRNCSVITLKHKN